MKYSRYIAILFFLVSVMFSVVVSCGSKTEQPQPGPIINDTIPVNPKPDPDPDPEPEPDPPAKSKVFDVSKIALSLGVVSDVHLNGTSDISGKFENALGILKAKALEEDPSGLAGVLVCGDLVDNPKEAWIAQFKSVYSRAVGSPKNVPMIYTIGNHDIPKYAWASTMVSDAAYIREVLGKDWFRTDLDNNMGKKYEARHCLVGDCHILAVSPDSDQPINYNPDALKWLDNQLDTLTQRYPEQYVIVITHPMIYNTVYGSLLGEADGIWESSLPNYWATRALSGILEKYPQAVVFGGHLHFPLNDPRSVWQGNFTVFGCGSVRYMAIEPGRYEDMSSATVMKDNMEYSQGNLLQIDSCGNMRVLRMDFYNNSVIGDPIVLSYPQSDKSHLEKYSFDSRSLANTAPEISVPEVSVSGGKLSVKWNSGTDDEFVHHYVVSIAKDGKTVATKKFLADFYKVPVPSQMKKEWRTEFETSGSGMYSVTITAFDSWDAVSETAETKINI